MKFPAILFAILVFVTSFVGQTASLPAPADDALVARLENEVGTPAVLITDVDTAVDAEDSTFAAKNGGNKKAKHGKGKKGKKGKGGKGGKKKGEKKGGATGNAA